MVNIFLRIGFFMSILSSFVCFYYILGFPHSVDGITSLNMINVFGNFSQKILLFTTFCAVAADILIKKK